MQATTQNISGVIQSNTLLRIPYFQRHYVWKTDSWERLADDMESTLNSTRQYFLGSIILKEEATSQEDIANGIGQKYLVIDGQQRLTTLSIYMKVIYLLTGKNDTFTVRFLQANDLRDPIIKHSRDDAPVFNEIMHKDVASPINKNNLNLMESAYNYFLSRLKAQRDKGMDLNTLLNTINARITFVSISLTSTDDEQQIFDTINSLGIPLTTADLMKNYLYEAGDEEAYRQNWYPVFDDKNVISFWESDSSSTRQKKKDNSTIERFFHAFVRIKMWDFDLSDEQKKSFVKMENVFSTCKAFTEEFGMGKQDLANEIIAYAKLYKDNLDETILNVRIPMYAGIERISFFINATKNYSVIPYVLYVLKAQNNLQERQRIFEYLETYLVRRVLAASNNNSYSDLFTENLINGHKNTYVQFKEYIDQRDGNLMMPTEDSLKLAMNSRLKELDEKTARTLYYIYETKLAPASNPNSIDGCYNDYVAWQIMPKKAYSPAWPQRNDASSEETRKMLVGTFGNYFLMEEGGNKDMKKVVADSWKDKTDIIKSWSSRIRSSCQMLANLTDWTEREIKLRNEQFAKNMCQLFVI